MTGAIHMPRGPGKATKVFAYILEGQKTVWYLTKRTEAGAYVRLFIVVKEEIVEISKLAARAMGTTYVESKGIYRRGTGYGHGSDTVDNLGWDLFKDAVKLKAREL
jgi:hypothetical protein